MKYKVLILDLDGTTVIQGSEEPPTERVTNAIAEARKKIHVCIATGRPLPLAKHIIDHLNLSGPCIINNGTQIYDPEKNEVIKEFPLDRSSLRPILKVFKKHKQEISFFNGEVDIAGSAKDYPEIVFSVYLSKTTEKLADILMKDLQKIPHIAVHKMLSSETAGYFSLEVTSDQATKLHGIVEVTKILNVKKEEVIGVGDSYNDFPLLMASGLKIAMGNAAPELKEIADFVAPPVEEDGVATIIEKFILAS
ncbi:HAD family phosphatase [Candidatus Gottesmanbacteria bacterium]|nr:HAD family phosphatase [Candidatus Gottesmanbacteria bacterium]